MPKKFEIVAMNKCLCFSSTRAMLGVMLIALVSLAKPAPAEDWPQWRGPNRNGISQETGWQAAWPQEGPRRVWEASGLGIGYSSLAVSQGRVYTMGNIDEVDHVFCLDAQTGKVLWDHHYPCSSKDPNGYRGTRCTPTVDDGRVYTVSRQGHFFCLDAATGKVFWSKNFVKDFGAEPPKWGYAGSPLIEKDWVLVEVGAKGASVVAFDKKTGAIVWKNGDDEPAYSSLVAFDNGGERCLAQFSSEYLVGRRMKDGAELWRYRWKTSYGINAATPIVAGDRVFISSGYGQGCALLQVSPRSVQQVWRNRKMRNHVNSCVLVDGYLYGFDESELKCLDFKTGEEKWGDRSYGKGSLLYADGKLILYSQNGKLGLAETTPTAFKEICHSQVLGGKDTWAMPVLANGRIYCRSMEKAVCLDVQAH